MRIYPPCPKCGTNEFINNGVNKACHDSSLVFCDKCKVFNIFDAEWDKRKKLEKERRKDLKERAESVNYNFPFDELEKLKQTLLWVGKKRFLEGYEQGYREALANPVDPDLMRVESEDL